MAPARASPRRRPPPPHDAEHTVTLQNKTDERIWVGSSASADGSAPLTGLPTLDPGQSAKITIPENSGAGHWRGTLFPRKGCTGEEGSTFHCAVGDCGPYADRCSTGEQPTSLAEFNFDTRDAAAPWYDVSYVNAVSTPITITPDGVPPPEDGGECAEVGCATDLLAACPPENLTKDQATGKPLVCVNPNRDAKTAYSDALAQKCPKAYSWSKHDAESGNQVMRQCSKCKGMTVTFHGNGTPENPNPTNPNPNPQPSPSDPNPGDPAPAVGKKGINLNPFDGADKALAESGASWYHNWASSTGEVAKPDGVEFVPTIWGPGSVNDAELGKAKQEGKNLLTFNEPDLPSQANMTPEQALDLWPQLEKTGLPLGAPAVATDADKPDGWLDRFMKGAAERGLRVDFIPVHWYGSDFGPAATDQLMRLLAAHPRALQEADLADRVRPHRLLPGQTPLPQRAGTDRLHQVVGDDAGEPGLRAAVRVVHPWHQDQPDRPLRRHERDRQRPCVPRGGLTHIGPL